MSTLGSARYSFLKRRTISLLMFLEKEWKRLLIIVALCPEDLYQKKRTEFERQKLERQQVIDILIALKVFQICSSFFFGISFKTVTADAQYDSTKLRETVSNYSVNLSCLTGNAPRLDLFAFNQDHLVSVF